MGDVPAAAAHNGAVQSGRQYGLTVVVGLASAAVVAVGVARPWVEATATVPGLPRIEVIVSGADLAPLAGAVGLALLAAFGAVLATRGRARQAVGLLIVAGAAVVLVSAVHRGDTGAVVQDRLATKGWTAAAGYSASIQVWRWVALGGAVGCLAAGLLVVRRGASWPTMGRRYDAPAAAHPTADSKPASSGGENLDEEALWRALDEGRDPTRGP